MKKPSANNLLAVFAVFSVLVIFILVSQRFEEKLFDIRAREYLSKNEGQKIVDLDAYYTGYKAGIIDSKPDIRELWISVFATIATFIMAGLAALSHRAYKKASASADAANARLENLHSSAHIATRKELKAYIYPTGKCEIIDNKNLGWAHSFWCRAELKNSGKTPAYKVRYRYQLDFVNMKVFDGGFEINAKRENLPDIGPNQSFWIVGPSLPQPDKFDRIRSGEEDENLCFWGAVEYWDEWGEYFESPFYFIYNRPDSIGGEKMNWVIPKFPEYQPPKKV